MSNKGLWFNSGYNVAAADYEVGGKGLWFKSGYNDTSTATPPTDMGLVEESFTLIANQSLVILNDIVDSPETSVLIIDNHPLQYGTGYTISGSIITLTTDYPIELGDFLTIVYTKQ